MHGEVNSVNGYKDHMWKKRINTFHWPMEIPLVSKHRDVPCVFTFTPCKTGLKATPSHLSTLN